MTRILLIDDEAIVRKGIRQSIDWEKYDVEIVGEAQNGIAALELALQYIPDIVITDIKMPLMDGLELARELKKNLPGTKIVILNGYEEFTYAKEALTIGVNDYLLKPIREEELVCVIQKLQKELEEEKIEQDDRKQSQSLLNKNYLYIKAKFVNRVLRQEFKNIDYVVEEAKQLKFTLDGPMYCAFAIDFDDAATLFQTLSEKDKEVTKYAIYNVVEESFLQKATGVIAYGEAVPLVGIMNTKSFCETSIKCLFKYIQSNVKNYLNISISFGIGSCCPDILNVEKSYGKAAEALKQNLYLVKTSSTSHKSVDRSMQTSGSCNFDKEEKAIIRSLKELNIVELREEIDSIFERFDLNYVEYTVIKDVCCNLVNIVLRYAEESGVNENECSIYSEMNQFEVPGDLHNWVVKICSQVVTAIQENRSKKYLSIVRIAVKYMGKNYGENITLADISKITFVSPNYFSKVFKAAAGVNFVDWLNQFRIEKAALFLRETNLKIYEVAEKVGFSDYKYFSSTFKKLKGCSPKQYKEEVCNMESSFVQGDMNRGYLNKWDNFRI